MAELFRLVKYYNLPRWIFRGIFSDNPKDSHQFLEYPLVIKHVKLENTLIEV